MFYLNFSKDKYKVSYICDTLKDENHNRIHEEFQTTFLKNTHLTPKARGSNSNRPKNLFETDTLDIPNSIERFAHPKDRS